MTRRNLLASIVERWIEENPRRSISKLSRITSVNYQVINRILQKECDPEQSNALALLNVCGSLDETIEYFVENPAIANFKKRIVNDWKITTDVELMNKLTSKNSCLITIMALTTGARHDEVLDLLGRVGLSEFNNMVDEGFLKESKTPGIYCVDENIEVNQIIENMSVGASVIRIFSDLPPNDASLLKFFAHNVDLETFNEIKKIYEEAYVSTLELVKDKEGPYIVLGSSITTILNYKAVEQ